MPKLTKVARLTMRTAAPLAFLLIAGAIAVHLYGQTYREKINSKSFIDIAVRSVEEAYQLILKAEQTASWSRWLGIAGGILAGIALLSFLIWRFSRKRKEPNPSENAQQASGAENVSASSSAAAEDMAAAAEGSAGASAADSASEAGAGANSPSSGTASTGSSSDTPSS